MSEFFEVATREFDTIIDFLRFGLSKAEAANLYYGHGTDNAWDDVWALIMGSLALPLNVDPLLLQGKLSPEEKHFLVRQLQRRIIEHVPVPYLTNKAYFCGLEFYVDERVLIPRSPVAEIIEEQFAPWIDPARVERIMDLCTGSGCIAIACAYAFPDAWIDGIDKSRKALEVAEKNGLKHGVDATVQWIESDCFDKVPRQQYDIIISNPPYVGREEMQTLPAEYLHEPNIALEAENNGLAIVETILSNAHHYLSDHGILVVEVGNSQEALIDAYPDLPFTWLEFERGGHGVFLLTAEQLRLANGRK